MKHQITQHSGNSLPSLGADKVSKQLTKKKKSSFNTKQVFQLWSFEEKLYWEL